LLTALRHYIDSHKLYYLIFVWREKRHAYRAVEGKPERRRPFGRPRHRWKNIEINRLGGHGMD